MNWFTIYLFTRVTTINDMSIVFFVISLIIVLSTGIGYAICKTSQTEHLRYGTEDRDYQAWTLWLGLWTKILKPSTVVLAISMMLVILVPTQREIAAIYLIPKIANSETTAELSKVPGSVAKILNAKLQEYLDNIDPIKVQEVAK